MDTLLRSFEYARQCVEARSDQNAAAVATFLVAFERLERSSRWTHPEPELLTAARQFVREHGDFLGRVAALSLTELPPIPSDDCDPTELEALLSGVLAAAESQTMLLPHLPKRAAGQVRDRLAELAALVELEPERFKAISAQAVAHLEAEQIAPGDSRWPIWSKVAQSAHLAQAPIPEVVPSLKATLDHAWREAEDQGLVQLAPSWAAGVLAKLQDWLHPAPMPSPLLAATERPTPKRSDAEPGCVPLLLYDPATGTGKFAELRLNVATDQRSGLFGPDKQLRALAWEAVHGAFQAAACLMPSCWPAHALEDHTLEIRVEEHEPVVDGESLGLPAALAFLSLWANQPLPSGLAATGRLLGDRVGAVAGIQAKAIALLATWGYKPVPRLLVAAEHAAAVRAVGVEPVEVSDLKTAVAAVGLDLSHAEVTSLGSVEDRLRVLTDLAADVEPQRLQRHRVSDETNPWLVLGDKIRVHIASLEAEQAVPPEVLDAARVKGALAYTHAGNVAAANGLLAKVEVSSETPASIRILKKIVELDAAIDRHDWKHSRSLVAALDEESEGLGGAHRNLLLGRIQGAQGRALMHERDLDAALPRLEQAVSHHAEHVHYEAGRSRIYLAMALRMAGRLTDALDTLQQAELDLREHTRRFSQPYAEMCGIYCSYEQARVLLEMGKPESAAEKALEALRAAEWRGWWPLLGILRTLAWATGALGLGAEREELTDRMKGLLRSVPEDHQTMARALVAEASGLPNLGYGEVY